MYLPTYSNIKNVPHAYFLIKGMFFSIMYIAKIKIRLKKIICCKCIFNLGEFIATYVDLYYYVIVSIVIIINEN